MSDPRMIPADEAKNIQILFSSFGNLSNRERKIRDLAVTVVAQASQIDRVREALHRIEQADEQAQHDWDTNYNPDSQNEALAYSLAAQWPEEALGDNDG